MKRILIILALNTLCLNAIYSQIIAGTDSAGLIISNPNINLSNSSVGYTVAGIFDVDCDSVADIRIDLRKGATAIDGSNNAYLNVLNPAIEICSDTALLGMYIPNYYNLNDTLYCNSNNTWRTDTIYGLGNYGCMECPGPFSKNNVYIAYRNNITSQVGWFKISFNLNDLSSSSTPITLTINEALSPCASTAINANTALAGTEQCGIFTFDYSITPANCNGACTGNITISNVTGGTPNYSFLWSFGSTTPYVGNACPGAYQVEISDAVGNICTSNFIVPNAQPFTFSLTANNASCYGSNDGSVCYTGLNGGDPPFFFEWNTTPNQFTSCISNLSGGNYTLCITDAQGCMVCASSVVNNPPEIQAFEIITSTSCTTCCDGEVQINAVGGSGLYTYNMDGNSCNSIVANLCAGTHTYCVTDGNGCEVCNTIPVPYQVSLKENFDENLFVISPNPSAGVISLSGFPDVVKGIQINIYDVLGRKVFSQFCMNCKIVELNLEELKRGVYTVQMVSGNSFFATQKFLKE